MMEFVRWLIFIKTVSQVVKRLKKIVINEKDCDNCYNSKEIVFFFYKKILHAPKTTKKHKKHQKHKKHKNATKKKYKTQIS